MRDENPIETFKPWVEKIRKNFPDIGYVHFVDGFTNEDNKEGDKLKGILRDANIPVMSNTNYTFESGNKRVEDYDEIIAYGKLFISNPDLPARAYNGWSLTDYDRSSFYGGTEKGYIE